MLTPARWKLRPGRRVKRCSQRLNQIAVVITLFSNPIEHLIFQIIALPSRGVFAFQGLPWEGDGLEYCAGALLRKAFPVFLQLVIRPSKFAALPESYPPKLPAIL